MSQQSQRRAREVRLRSRWRERPLLLFFLPALLAHLAAFGLMVLVSRLQPPAKPKPQVRAVSMRALSASQWDSNRGPSSASASRPATSKPRAPMPMPKGQVVDVAPGNRQVPVDSKYLAETNNRVEKQTVARVQVAAPGMAGTQMTTAGANRPPPHRAPTPKAARAHPVGLQDRLASLDGPSYRPSLLDLLRGAKANPTPAPAPDAPDAQSDTDGEQETGPSGQAPGAIGSGATGAANDDLNDLPKGDGTYLNTREFLFAGFFNRVKQAVSAKWNPTDRLRAQDPRGTRLGALSRTTVVVVTIDTEGVIKDLYVQKSCGIDFLDAEAMQAFSRAGPFPNPPRGLFGDREMFQFQFGFHLDQNPGGLPMMFRPGG